MPFSGERRIDRQWRRKPAATRTLSYSDASSSWDAFALVQLGQRFRVVERRVARPWIRNFCANYETLRGIRDATGPEQLLDEEEPDGGRLSHHKLVLDDSGVTKSTSVGDSLTRWPGIGRLEEDETYIYIYTAPGAAHVIPKRAFSSEAAASAFLEAARRWRQANAAVPTQTGGAL